MSGINNFLTEKEISNLVLLVYFTGVYVLANLLSEAHANLVFFGEK
jgi:hypothetical protein